MTELDWADRHLQLGQRVDFDHGVHPDIDPAEYAQRNHDRNPRGRVPGTHRVDILSSSTRIPLK
jgi:hypothetical protein